MADSLNCRVRDQNTEPPDSSAMPDFAKPPRGSLRAADVDRHPQGLRTTKTSVPNIP